MSALLTFSALFQGGFIPDAVLYLSYWYTRNELSFRLALFFCTNSITALITNFFSIGLIEMSGIRGYSGWRWMFLIQGLFTLLIGGKEEASHQRLTCSCFILAHAPWPLSDQNLAPAQRIPGARRGQDRRQQSHARRLEQGKPLRSGPALTCQGTMHNREGLSLKLIWKALTDYHLWPMYLISFCFNLPAVPIGAYLQISFRRLGFSRIMSNLLAVPHTALTVITILGVTILSEAVNNRSFVCMIQNAVSPRVSCRMPNLMCQWYLPNFVALVVLPTVSGWQYFAISTVLLGYPWVHAIQVSWCSRNSGSVATRTVSAA